ncbi:MAG: hypothetical protein IPL15_10925 [Comamonadaceae bacterium]|nr:hypothetical protein [Comamonadaceae bacterium]
MKYRFAPCLADTGTAGCAALDQVARTSESHGPGYGLRKRCHKSAKPRRRTGPGQQQHVSAGLAKTGEVRSVNEGFQPHYRVFLKAGQVSIQPAPRTKPALPR